eukprot:CAMPEP_0183830860 /NCGR_PEP_ID=MMETSP0807_2-20130328/4277_1 /TAXON_ID=88271 /ORGANISM="Picocystis salinarum, Strain CCMP1897" /LENGTH=65 /DNA_ID=CAMNT_0026076255 /DNA_START=433 /DNA_END=627 /DNA_ORIENTATION=-
MNKLCILDQQQRRCGSYIGLFKKFMHRFLALTTKLRTDILSQRHDIRSDKPPEPLHQVQNSHGQE